MFHGIVTTNDNAMHISKIGSAVELEALREYFSAHAYLNGADGVDYETIESIAATLFKRREAGREEIKKALIILAHQTSSRSRRILEHYREICPPDLSRFAHFALEESRMWSGDE